MNLKHLTIRCTGALLLHVAFMVCHAQDSTYLTLDETIKMAHASSLQAMEAKSLVAAGYWENRSFNLSLLPSLRANVLPLTYNRAMTKRYDSETNREVYRPQQTLSSYFDLSLQYVVPATGGAVYVDSDFGRLSNFQNTGKTTDYSATPFRIGITQPVMKFNELKWQKRIMPLQFARSRQQFILDQLTINLEVAELFFDLAVAHARHKMQAENVVNTAKLFELGQKRYNLGAIEKKDVLNLELAKHNALNEYAQVRKDFQKFLSNLSVYLGVELSMFTAPVFPDIDTRLIIDADDAIEKASRSHPAMLDYQLRSLEAALNVEKYMKGNRYDISLDASYGLNQSSNVLNSLYGNYLDQQRFSISVSMPVFDWNRWKTAKKAVEFRRQVEETRIKKDQLKFRQELVTTILDFNLQGQIVESAKRAKEIAWESYSISQRRFSTGNVTVLELTMAWSAYQGAVESYMNNLKNYWIFYYRIQQLTMFDYKTNSRINNDLDPLHSDK